MTKYLGNRSHGGGNAKNRRGKGCKGGKGRAGWHKHKWLKTINDGENKNRKRGFCSVRAKLEEFTLEDLNRMIESGELKGDKITLKNAKVLSNGELRHKVSVKATAFTAKAIEKIKAAGGEASNA